MDASTEPIWVRPWNMTTFEGAYARAACAPVPNLYLAAFEWGLLLITGMDVDPATGPNPPIFQKADGMAPTEIATRASAIIIGSLMWT